MQASTSSTTVPSSQDVRAAIAADNKGTAMPLSTRMVLSAFAGMGAATFCHPLDVIRVNMQTAGEGAYKNTLDAGLQIYRQAGFSGGIYAGISAAYLRQWLYGSCRMGIYSYLLERAQIQNQQAGRNKNEISFTSKLFMGCCSGAIGSFVGTPSELALVRMSADSKAPVEQRRNYNNVIDCIVRISREEGLANLWRGAAPTVLRATLLSACSLGVTSEAKQVLADSGYFGPNGEYMNGYPKMFCATLISSFCANVVANPFDVIKSRLQNMPINADGTALYNGMVDCFVKSVRAEGPMVVYAGFTPAFVKLAPYSIISLTLADKLTKALTGKDAL
ncbi:Mitochondrial 2-oxoglutarate/malate carrier protein [Seminavis robusta]|uniref:Mitochondrial 2-oxoglutarate/malate carrier protein n=1 Tax=Seminavis robusta TaxID=568900 RepID=A0A9N8EL65_9STRA|nr:Mitochondrial 2-oxoglutarate/malate carrier protein [Seminavis robusta]|eukprot:Sro1334_g263790.1 Mitochondrial 2-oxoglutarate/malate carrier protein (334) ;mRNA; r:12697-13698